MYAVVMEHVFLQIIARVIVDIMVSNVKHITVHKFDSIHRQYVHQMVHVLAQITAFVDLDYMVLNVNCLTVTIYHMAHLLLALEMV
jgi:hypothetical protein